MVNIILTGIHLTQSHNLYKCLKIALHLVYSIQEVSMDQLFCPVHQEKTLYKLIRYTKMYFFYVVKFYLGNYLKSLLWCRL